MRFEYNNISYDFGANIDAYIFASFLKKLPEILSHSEEISSLKDELKNMALANATANDKLFNRSLVKVIRLFHSDRSYNESNSFSAVIRMGCNGLTCDNAIWDYVCKQSIDENGFAKDKVKVIANSITIILNACKNRGSLIIADENKSENSDFANFLYDYSGVERPMVKPTPILTRYNLFKVATILAVAATTAYVVEKIYCSPKNH